MKDCFQAVADCFHHLHQEHSWWLASSQGHSQILSCSCGEPSFLHGCEMKSGSGLHGDKASWWL